MLIEPIHKLTTTTWDINPKRIKINKETKTVGVVTFVWYVDYKKQ